MSIRNIGVLRVRVCMILVAVLVMAGGDVTAQDRARESSEPLRFGVMADAQYCDCAVNGSRHYRASPGKMRDAVEQLNREELDFVIHLGDLIDRDFESFDEILPIYRQLQVPTYQVLGNHDFAIGPSKKDEVLRRMGLYRRYYDFVVGSWRFVVLDTNDLSLYARREGTAKYRRADSLHQKLVADDRPNAKEWNGGVSREQLHWLDRTLAEAAARDQRVVIFTHHPVYPSNAHNVWNDDEVRALLGSRDNVAAVMSGHNHGGNYGAAEGIHFLTLKGMVETADSTAYAVIETSGTRLEVNGFGREVDRSLDISGGR